MNRIAWISLALVAPLLYIFARRLLAWLLLHTAIGAAFSEAGRRSLAKQPDRVHLTPMTDGGWKKPDWIAGVETALVAEGFLPVGAFSVPELPEVRVKLMVLERESMTATLYEHDRAGCWFELTTTYANGTAACFSTLPATGLDERPGHALVRAPGADPRNLFRRAMAERPRGVFRAVSRANVVSNFEAAYAESAAWRKSHGVSAQEVARVAVQKAA
jgi:hypothetical protein